MNIFRKSRNKEAFYGSLGSVIFHFIVMASVVLLLKAGDGTYSSSGGGEYYVDIASVKGIPSSIKQQSLPEKTDVNDTKEVIPPEKRTENENYAVNKTDHTFKAEKPVPEKRTGSGLGFQNIESAGFDSTSLGQFYRESTLNVRMRYPQGWVYIDQQRKKRLDGITFWASGTNFNPPPYIHVEVVDKYIFNPAQYKYKYDFDKFTGYYNEPVELENQVSQVIYLRTDDDEDYTIKLIMENKEAFKQFQPVFFAIVKSFEFGNSFL